MSNTVSLEKTHFSSDFQVKMNTDACLYANTTTFPTCRTVVQGIAKEGIISSIIQIENTLMSFKDRYDKTPNPLMSLTTTDMLECNSLIYDGIAPAVSILTSERSKEMSDMLDETSNVVIKYAIIGNVVAVLVIIYHLFYFYPTLIVQRKTLTRTILLLPPYLITRNKYLKDFLLRQDKKFFEFIKIFQEQEQSYSIESLLGKKTKVITVAHRDV